MAQSNRIKNMCISKWGTLRWWTIKSLFSTKGHILSWQPQVFFYIQDRTLQVCAGRNKKCAHMRIPGAEITHICISEWALYVKMSWPFCMIENNTWIYIKHSDVAHCWTSSWDRGIFLLDGRLPRSLKLSGWWGGMCFNLWRTEQKPKAKREKWTSLLKCQCWFKLLRTTATFVNEQWFC